jgi:hypothetical protein
VCALSLFVATPIIGQNSRCARPVTLQTTDLTDARAVLARALNSLKKDRHQSEMFRRSVRSEGFCADSANFLERWGVAPSPNPRVVNPLPVAAALRGNSAYPRDRNDGAMWNGVGLNTEISAGGLAQWRFMRAGLYPKVIYQQNEDYDYPNSEFLDRSEFANPFISGIDLPKRMGAESFSNFDAGQSFIEATSSRAYAAFSNENLWIGPTQVHSLLLSNTAAGFPHFRIGTARPLDLRFVRLEAQLFFGSVKESDYLVTGNARSYLFQGTLLFLEPKILPGLHLGIARILRDTTQATGHSVGYYLNRIMDSPFWDGGESGLDAADRQSGLYARWVNPASGFEAYMEWGREDFPFSFLNLIIEPDYTQVWAAGFQKVYLSDKRLTRIYGEFLHLGQAAPIRAGRAFVRFYATRPPGFTNRGQMLGAGAGPGSDAQTVGFDMFDATSRTGVMLERVRYDEDTYYEQFSRRWSESRHDVEVSAEIRRTQWVGPVQIEGALRYSHRWNRDFISALNESPDMSNENNIGTEMFVRWTPRW